MAVSIKNNVIHMTADGDTYAPGGRMKIRGVRLVSAAASGVATLRQTNVSGQALMKLEADANQNSESQINFTCEGTLYLELSGAGAEVFVYLE